MSTAGERTVRKLDLGKRVDVFVQLGRLFHHVGNGDAWPGHACGLSASEYETFEATVRNAYQHNGWFTEENVRHALAALAALLDPAALRDWLANYPELKDGQASLTVGLVLAGNVPLVGFHDLLCVLLAGHRARLKVSSQDAGLTAAVVSALGHFSPDLAGHIEIAEDRLGEVDAVIATGSNNTARYFDHYFKHLPRIVRKNRVSVAVLDGSETEAELAALGEDVFRYFGLGCRNVAKLFVPRDFDLDRIFGAFFPWKEVINHNKYANNYDYNKAIWLLDRVAVIENGFLLLKEEGALASPVAALHYERYDDVSAVKAALVSQTEQIQCVVGHGHLPFGQAQCPGPAEYADGIDTMRFLIGLPQSVNS